MIPPRPPEFFEVLSPLKRFPVLRDTQRGRVIPESTIIIAYLQTYAPGRNFHHGRQYRGAGTLPWRPVLWTVP